MASTSLAVEVLRTLGANATFASLANETQSNATYDAVVVGVQAVAGNAVGVGAPGVVTAAELEITQAGGGNQAADRGRFWRISITVRVPYENA